MSHPSPPLPASLPKLAAHPATASGQSRWRRLFGRRLRAQGRSLQIRRSGWLFILLTLAVGFAAINSGSNLLHALFGAQMALIVGSGALSERSVSRAKARRVCTGDLHAQTPTSMRVELHCRHARGDLLAVSIEDDERDKGGGHCDPVFCVRVGPGETAQLQTKVTMPTRGRHKLPAAVVSTSFPFGMFVKTRELAPPPTVTVYPRIRTLAPVQSRDIRPGSGEASGRVARVGEFFGMREYRDGDDPRRIYWPALARSQRPIVREHEAHGDTELIVDLEHGVAGNASFEDKVEHAASVAVDRLRGHGVAVGLRYAGQLVVPPSSGPTAQRRLLEYLATVGQDPTAAEVA